MTKLIEYFEDVTNLYNVEEIALSLHTAFSDYMHGISYVVEYRPEFEDVVVEFDIDDEDININDIKDDLVVVKDIYKNDFISDEEYADSDWTDDEVTVNINKWIHPNKFVII